MRVVRLRARACAVATTFPPFFHREFTGFIVERSFVRALFPVRYKAVREAQISILTIVSAAVIILCVCSLRSYVMDAAYILNQEEFYVT
jgi:hypothetical protein